MNYERVKYRLFNRDTNTELWLSDGTHTNNPAPKNWDTAEKTLKRSTKTYGVYTELSKNLEFTKRGYDFLLNAYNYRDIEADVICEEYRKHPLTEAWYIHSIGNFDFSGCEDMQTTFKVPFKSGGLNALIQSQIRENFDLKRTEAINGNEITPINTVEVLLEGREILLISTLENTNKASVSEPVEVNTNIISMVIFNMDIIANSDQENIAFPFGNNFVSIFDFDGNPQTPNDNISGLVGTNNFFYLNNTVEKTLNVNIDFDIIAYKLGGDDPTLNTKHKLAYYKYSYNESDSNYYYVEEYLLVDTGYGSNQVTGNIDTTIEMAVGDCLLFAYDVRTTNSTNSGLCEKNEIFITITEDSVREPSQTIASLYHDTGEQLSKIITGEEGRFYSEFYGREDLGYAEDSEFCRTAITSGFYIRQFFDKSMEISLNSYLNTSNVIHNTGYGIETKNGVECIVLEDLKYFFQDTTTITLTEQVSNVKRYPATDFYDSSLLFGYKDGGEYEEAMGLDEYNIQRGYVTNLTRVDTKFDKLSDARADSYGREFARRKPKLNYPEEDTRYDDDLHLLDLKLGLGNVLEERKWADDFETIPTGVYSPETASNLRLTPREINNRHQWFYGAGLRKFQDEKVRVSNNTGNDNLSTKKVGEPIQNEKDDINVSDLKTPRFYPQWIEFDSRIDFYVNEMVYGKTVINGREVPNFYGKVSFINEKNQREYGYLFELKPSNEGKWKVLKAI